jgi:hypothetical protein
MDGTGENGDNRERLVVLASVVSVYFVSSKFEDWRVCSGIWIAPTSPVVLGLIINVDEPKRTDGLFRLILPIAQLRAS